ncbi:hypothetical protein H0H93_008058 [Arthromyces matolae]|nr:hypothetical protein H0H93_008058 [Arthromyces matolae]
MHAPAPMRIHYLANGPYPTGTVAPPRYLQSASLVSDAGHSGLERGWSTAPSILTGPMAHPPSPPPSSFAHHLREPSIPKRLKNRRTGPDRASLRCEPPIPQRRIFLVPRPAALQPPASTSTTVQHINHAIFPPSKLSRHCDVLPLASAADDLQSTSNPSVRDACSRPSSTSIAPSPAIDEDDSILDRFVVDSAIAYTPAILNLESSDQDIAAKARNLCSSFLDVFRDLKRYVRFLEYRGNDAQRLIDSMQSLLDDGLVEPQFRVILIVALSRLARKSELYPSRYKLHGVTRLPGTFAEGHFGDIQKGRFDGRVVSIKALSREIVPWAQICHPNVLPFYGIILLDDECDRFGIVSPFLENGNVIDFLEVNPAADRRSLIHGVASGMRHLHDCGIVHGDIKGRNILVTDSEPPRAVLADFGFATIIDASGLKSPQLSSNAVEGGTPRFEAPELFNPNIPYRRTVASDVYAFSMASYEILSGDIPFPNKRDVHVMVMVAEGKRPNRPIGELYLNRGLDDSMWTLMQDCWAQDSNSRPSSRHILERLSIGPGLGVDGGDWGNLAPSWFLKNHDPQISVPQTDY